MAEYNNSFFLQLDIDIESGLFIYLFIFLKWIYEYYWCIYNLYSENDLKEK